jgi:FtsH-binding integral membrane protein
MDFINSKQATNTKVYDQGLREHILKVYKLMCLGIGLTGFISYFTANTPALLGLLYSNTGVTPFGWLVTFAPLILCFVFSAKINTMSSASAQMLFWVFAATMGLSLTYISLVYTGTSIFRVFLVTSSLFGVMSIYGHTTKKDLTNIGSFLFMGLIYFWLVQLYSLLYQ